ncbi:hypothetical protein BT96DRAFT_947294 [Gymnopus androsaceus JB14]|uniref:Uncharacterized protein n=1 Tax=Gymnopus androsaceus JB14 TaxID=1447944 RepID=A0A6A4GSW1_9AGAR|nr:hypothetical protein BT96DRAFT_947294 [Gymnopus androsaceus JB14]
MSGCPLPCCGLLACVETGNDIPAPASGGSEEGEERGGCRLDLGRGCGEEELVAVDRIPVGVSRKKTGIVLSRGGNLQWNIVSVCSDGGSKASVPTRPRSDAEEMEPWPPYSALKAFGVRIPPQLRALSGGAAGA